MGDGCDCAMIISAIDPGTTQSGYVETSGDEVLYADVVQNDELIEMIRAISGYGAARMIEPRRLVIERFEARGMPIGDESIETMIWTGRFMQAWHNPAEVEFLKRSQIKIALCGTAKAKDANIRQALIDRLGSPGTKKAPGPTYGVTSHAWAALAVAVVAQEIAP